ncbi:protein creg1, partial [Quercus suber]
EIRTCTSSMTEVLIAIKSRRVVEKLPETNKKMAINDVEKRAKIGSTVIVARALRGNVVSFSDGLPNKGSGIPYFYLTTLDPTVRDALKDDRASFTISEYPIGTCGKIDPENPTCAEITLTGKVMVSFYFTPTPATPTISLNMNNRILFSKSETTKTIITEHLVTKQRLKQEAAHYHTSITAHLTTGWLTDWPGDHSFQFFKLEIENIFLIDWFSGPKPLTLDQYLHTSLAFDCMSNASKWHVTVSQVRSRESVSHGGSTNDMVTHKYSRVQPPNTNVAGFNCFSLVKQIISKSNGWNAISMKCQSHDKFRAERMSSEITPIPLISNPHHLYRHLSVPTPSNYDFSKVEILKISRTPYTCTIQPM